MSKNHVKTSKKEETHIIPSNPASPVMQEKTPTPFKTVGTVRLSKSGNAISIKLFPENRFLHIAKRDIELILIDKNNSTVANVREYDKIEVVKEGKNNG